MAGIAGIPGAPPFCPTPCARPRSLPGVCLGAERRPLAVACGGEVPPSINTSCSSGSASEMGWMSDSSTFAQPAGVPGALGALSPSLIPAPSSLFSSPSLTIASAASGSGGPKARSEASPLHAKLGNTRQMLCLYAMFMSMVQVWPVWMVMHDDFMRMFVGMPQ